MTPAADEAGSPYPSGVRVNKDKLWDFLVKRAILGTKAKDGVSRNAIVKHIMSYNDVRKSNCEQACTLAMKRMMRMGQIYRNSNGLFRIKPMKPAPSQRSAFKPRASGKKPMKNIRRAAGGSFKRSGKVISRGGRSVRLYMKVKGGRTASRGGGRFVKGKKPLKKNVKKNIKGKKNVKKNLNKRGSKKFAKNKKQLAKLKKAKALMAKRRALLAKRKKTSKRLAAKKNLRGKKKPMKSGRKR